MLNYRVPCDHVPVRSWPLFKARQLMRGVIESFNEVEHDYHLYTALDCRLPGMSCEYWP